MKESLKIILIVLCVMVGVIALDTLQAKIFDNSPFIKIRKNFKDGYVQYMDKGLLVNHYHCKNNEDVTAWKFTKFVCSIPENKKEIKEIVDLVARDNLTCDTALEKFYQDENYTYSYSCIKNDKVIVKYNDGSEETVKEALENNKITIQDLDRFNIAYIKEEIENNKEKLNLENYQDNPIFLNYGEENIIKTKNINLSHTILTERIENKYNNDKELANLVKYIKDTFDIEINNKWEISINYYNNEKADGLVQFVYTIGEIKTNRSITFVINKDKYDKVYYMCLNDDIDEKNLINRVNLFKNKYVQGKKNLKDGEKFYEENTNFTYYINVDKLIYTYSYFFKYNNDIINDDWGTVRLIDENGNAKVIN